MSRAFDADNNGVETNLTRFYLYLVFIIIIFDLINTSSLSLSRYICVLHRCFFRVVESVR